MAFEDVVQALSRGPGEAPRSGPLVLLQGAWKRADDGWGVALRACTRAMKLGGLDVRLQDWLEPLRPPEEAVLAEVGDAGLPVRSWDVQVFSSGLAGAEHMRPALESLIRAPRPRAFYAFFERRHIERALVDLLNQLDGVWVQCRMNRDVLVGAGVKRVTYIPYPFFEDDPLLELPRNTYHDPVRLYWIGRNEPRKAPENLVRAFLRGVVPGQATLTLKLSAYKHPLGFVTTLEDVIWDECRTRGWWTEDAALRSIRFIRGRLSHEEMRRLHIEHDVYVAASRGEGLDLPCWEAKLAGKRVVTPASGGPEDFMDPASDVVVPATGLVDAEEHYFTWGPGATYIDYSVDALARAIRKVVEERRKGSRSWPGMEKHRAGEVGRAFARWIKSLQ